MNWSALRQTKHHNSIEEAEAERNPANVRRLWIQGVEFASVERRLRQFSRLECLEFRWCPTCHYSPNHQIEFSPELRTEILELRNLKSFGVLNTPVREFPIWLAPLPKLEKLMARGTEVSEIPAEIRFFSRLRKLELSNNDIREAPVEIAQLLRLEELGLHSTLVTEIPFPVLRMPRLRALQLTGHPWPADAIARIKQHFPMASLPPAQANEKL